MAPVEGQITIGWFLPRQVTGEVNLTNGNRQAAMLSGYVPHERCKPRMFSAILVSALNLVDSYYGNCMLLHKRCRQNQLSLGIYTPPDAGDSVV